MVKTSLPERSQRLTSLDAYRGFVMLAMASGGLAFAPVFREHREQILAEYGGTAYAVWWQRLWETLSYQFDHVAWTGCSIWDLIQPSFMFMVGVSMPFSYSKRKAQGQSELRMLGHAVFRSIVLILLAIFLMSNRRSQTHYEFVNVLAQIGLGYTFVYLLWRLHWVLQLVALAGILGGYWYFFYQYEIPASEYKLVRQYIAEKTPLDPDEELGQFEGLAAHWNKHTNAAAAFDRQFLSRYPRPLEPWNGRTYWINRGGYQTLNFIPSIATMLLGVMAGRLLRGQGSHRRKLLWLLGAGGICFLIAMGIDTTIWPVKIAGWDWSLCPVVKRIWTPSWAVFSAGWTFWILAGFYLVIDVWRWKWWAFPLVVVGMNSIVMYCMAQLIKPWIGRTLKTHLTTLDALAGWQQGATYYLFSEAYPYAAIWRSVATLFVLWLVCLWLYRKRIFVRI